MLNFHLKDHSQRNRLIWLNWLLSEKLIDRLFPPENLTKFLLIETSPIMFFNFFETLRNFLSSLHFSVTYSPGFCICTKKTEKYKSMENLHYYGHERQRLTTRFFVGMTRQWRKNWNCVSCRKENEQTFLFLLLSFQTSLCWSGREGVNPQALQLPYSSLSFSH